MAFDQLLPPSCRLVDGLDSVRFCRGCEDVQNKCFGARKHAQSRAGYNGNSSSWKTTLHGCFSELDRCSKKCLHCRVYRQALLFTGHTFQAARRLAGSESPVLVELQRDSFYIKISGVAVARIHISKANPAETPKLVKPPSPRNSMEFVMAQARTWLRTCLEQHGPRCSNLRWSNNNPSWLIQIIDAAGTNLRLIEGTQIQYARYVALSYSWGDSKLMRDADWARVKANKTKVDKFFRRKDAFEASELSRTVQDAIRITKGLGVDYLWVDAVCIPDKSSLHPTDWNLEASKMYEVYGNAVLTLVTGAVENAAEPLLYPRAAWDYPIVPCTLAMHSLEVVTPDLDSARTKIPIANRAWTLQEERLSPRLLYWCGQMLYWSCAVAQLDELGHKFTMTEPSGMCPPQSFLQKRWEKNSEELQAEWLDLVEDYVRRDIGFPEDRFPAISGLAVQYYQAQLPYTTSKSNEEYLAGLWRNSFARQLVWSVQTACDPKLSLRLQAHAPSWSWASLPRCVKIQMKGDFEPAPHFKLHRCENQSSKAPLDVVRRGARISRVTVEGRFRPLITPESQTRRWDEILWRGNSQAGELYDFDDPSISVHATDNPSGRVLVYEAHFSPIVSQLDYLPSKTADSLDAQPLAEGIYVCEGWETQLYAMEVGISAMLILKKAFAQKNHLVFYRVGVSRAYRASFFDMAPIARIVLK